VLLGTDMRIVGVVMGSFYYFIIDIITNIDVDLSIFINDNYKFDLT
jgi:hypothetical protein